MRPSYKRMWGGFLPGLLLGAMLVGLAACAPFGVAPPAAQASAGHHHGSGERGGRDASDVTIKFER